MKTLFEKFLSDKLSLIQNTIGEIDLRLLKEGCYSEMPGFRVAQVAFGELGNVEIPVNSNKQEYGQWYGMNGVPWCAIFVSWVYDRAGFPLPLIDTPNGFHYCPSGLNYFKANGLLTAKPNIGDIVFYDWLGDRKMDHVGIYLQDNGDHNTFMAIEGNTAVNNDSNGGKVMIRSRLYSMATFAHPTQLIPNPSKPE